MSERPIPVFDDAFTMPITRDVSQILAEHYAYACQLSGADIRSGNFQVDHIFPKVLGGPDNLQNYIAAHASANAGKSGRRLTEDEERPWLDAARVAAPSLLARLVDLRSDSGGKPVNPLVVYAFRLIGAEVGTRVATGAYLRALDGPAHGVHWWGYFGPDLKGGIFVDTLQFGVKVLGRGRRNEGAISAVEGIRARGGSTYYFPIDSSLPLHVDRDSLLRAQRVIAAACG